MMWPSSHPVMPTAASSSLSSALPPLESYLPPLAPSLSNRNPLSNPNPSPTLPTLDLDADNEALWSQTDNSLKKSLYDTWSAFDLNRMLVDVIDEYKGEDLLK